MVKEALFELNCLCHPSILIRKCIYDKTNLYNPCFRQAPDFLMWTNILKFTSIYVVNQKLVRLRILSSNRNASADTPENRIRNINEISLIMDNYFLNMSENDFLDGFGDLLIKRNQLTEEEIKCEQAFIFLKNQSNFSYVYHQIGLKKIYGLLQDQKTREALASSYCFTENDFFSLTGSESFVNSLRCMLKYL